jgi:antitoxin FitA
MSTITIHQLEPLNKHLEERAAQHEHTIEAEIKFIIHSVLTADPVIKSSLAEAIDRRFAPLGDFELPKLTRETMLTVPNFESTL